jgi:hypothetical protein
MYLAMILVVMVAAPIVCLLVELALMPGSHLATLVGKWFVFWCVGVRLLLAGVRQITHPEYTARDILGIQAKGAEHVVQELGFANSAIGLLGLLAIINPPWVAAAAIVGAAFLGLAGVRHAMKSDRNRIETIAMVSDFWAFVVLTAYLFTLMRA